MIEEYFFDEFNILSYGETEILTDVVDKDGRSWEAIEIHWQDDIIYYYNLDDNGKLEYQGSRMIFYSLGPFVESV